MKKVFVFLISFAFCAGQKLGPEQQQFCKGVEEVQCGMHDARPPFSCESVGFPQVKPLPTTGNPIQDARRAAPPPAPPSGPYGIDRFPVALGRSAGKFENWPGKVRFSVSNGRVQIQFFPACNFKQPEPNLTDSEFNPLLFETQWYVWHKAFQTSPPLGSPIADTLSQLKQDAMVTASGRLIWATNGDRADVTIGNQSIDAIAYYLPSPTLSHFDRMRPGFIAEFTSIQPAK